MIKHTELGDERVGGEGAVVAAAFQEAMEPSQKLAVPFQAKGIGLAVPRVTLRVDRFLTIEVTRINPRRAGRQLCQFRR